MNNPFVKAVLLFLLTLPTIICAAQKITETSVVKDSSGTVYPAEIWRQLLLKGGHTLRAENKDDPNTAFILVRLTDEQKQARFAKMAIPKGSPFFKNGQKFSLGKVTDMQGAKIDLKDNSGKITVVNFWFVNCGPCRTEIPELNKLVANYASDSVRFVAIALDDKYALENFLKLMPFEYKIVDNGLYLAQRYGVQSYPTHVVVNQEGKVYFHTTGLASNTVYWIEKSIKNLLNKNGATASVQ